MLKITKAAAEHAIERFALGEANRLLAGHWLSLWQGDDLPRYEHFNLAKLRDLVPNILLFDVLPEKRVTVRKAGNDISRILHGDLDGRDWVESAQLRYRNIFMRNFSAIARGAAMKGCRRLSMANASAIYNEELALPFATRADGTCMVIGHVDWKMDYHRRFTAITGIPPLAGDRVLRFGKNISNDL